MFFDLKLLCSLCRICRIFSFKIIQIPNTVLLMQKISEEAKISYISYINYSEAWILILRQISLQNSCMIVTQVYMNPTWRKKCRVARPSGFCDSLLDTFGKRRISIISGFIWKRTQTTQTQPSAASALSAVFPNNARGKSHTLHL